MFVMRMSHSGKAFHVAFGTQAQEAFLEGHVLALEYFGAGPLGSAMTTSNRRWSGCCAGGTGSSPNDSSPCAAIISMHVGSLRCRPGPFGLGWAVTCVSFAPSDLAAIYARTSRFVRFWPL